MLFYFDNKKKKKKILSFDHLKNCLSFKKNVNLLSRYLMLLFK